ncbi:MAG: ABC transporter ATP-binding protein [Muribaculaceae bacterium]|nr:ABC transporter ATP-binding protein [Muribaculaceae bacterium]MDE5924994.1 ABC transporter ATP-binding protein [Muribaculaceae bacterium]
MKLIIKDLSFRYGRRRPLVLDHVTAELTEGGVVGLLGPNGAGKSTLLYLMAGLLTPLAGVVEYNGTSTRRRRPDVLSDIYLVPEEVTLPRMSLEEYIKLYSTFYPGFNREVLDDCLKEFSMDNPTRLDSVSMGQRKKIVLGFALACQTPVLLMDEPTNGLDIPGKAAFRRLVARYATDERLILISTHQVRDLDRILDRIMIMDSHRFVLSESVATLQSAFAFPINRPEVMPEALAAIPSPGGFDQMIVNDGSYDTDLNLELLFEAALNKPHILEEILNRTARI